MEHPMLEHALKYRREFDWTTIPVRNDKIAAVPWGQHQVRPPTEAELNQLFAVEGVAGLAVILGPVSGMLWARDFDEINSYRRWATAFPRAAAYLPTVLTARGAHVYGTWPDVGYMDCADGELRGDSKHYCILPPSRHATGHIYSWSVAPRDRIERVDPVTLQLDQPWRASHTQEHRNSGPQGLMR